MYRIKPETTRFGLYCFRADFLNDKRKQEKTEKNEKGG